MKRATRRRVRAVGTCRNTGKEQFTRHDAAHIARTNRRRDHEPWSEYHCTGCTWWHVGHHAVGWRRARR